MCYRPLSQCFPSVGRRLRFENGNLDLSRGGGEKEWPPLRRMPFRPMRGVSARSFTVPGQKYNTMKIEKLFSAACRLMRWLSQALGFLLFNIVTTKTVLQVLEL